VTPASSATFPWQLTGNHWLALPCIHPGDGSIHAIGVLHRGARAAMEFAGSPDFLEGTARPLLRPVVRIDGQEQAISDDGLAWERAYSWLPTYTGRSGPLLLRGVVFAPFGRDADVAGAVYALSVENTGSAPVRVGVSLDGVLGHRQLRVRTSRAAADAARAVRSGRDVIVLEGAAQPGFAALAIAADGEPQIDLQQDPPRFTIGRMVTIAPGAREHVAFYIAAGPERDGAEATVAVMRRRGWNELLMITRDSLQRLEQTVGHEGIDLLINRNLLFAYFFALGRALDDAHFYLVRSRAPWNEAGVTVRDWEALTWTLPAVQLADASLARELLLRACELHGYAPGNGVHYLDGTLFEPGFSLEGLGSFALAIDRYIRETGDEQIVEEPAVADTLYASWEDLMSRRDQHVPLYSTEVTPSGTVAAHPYTLHGNAVAALALDVFRRTLDEDTARHVEDPEAVRAALRRHFTIEQEGKAVLAAAIDLSGRTSSEEDELTSSYWLPLYEAIDRNDSLYRRTVRGATTQVRQLVQQAARLVGPDAAEVLQWLRRAPLDNGLAAAHVDAEGRATRPGGDAALSGLIAWTAWYAVHALGVKP
jgi:hypothetical protein